MLNIDTASASTENPDRKNLRDKSLSGGSTESCSAVRKLESSKSSERDSNSSDRVVLHQD